eukprot:363130-Chlamydomonas_euryale.AAC.8
MQPHHQSRDSDNPAREGVMRVALRVARCVELCVAPHFPHTLDSARAAAHAPAARARAPHFPTFYAPHAAAHAPAP